MLLLGCMALSGSDTTAPASWMVGLTHLVSSADAPAAANASASPDTPLHSIATIALFITTPPWQGYVLAFASGAASADNKIVQKDGNCVQEIRSTSALHSSCR